MGCDIHLFTERKRSINDKKQWVNIDHWKLNPYYESEEHESKWDIVSVFSMRNYALFSMLAGVRNGSENNSISEPRGLPDDCSKIIKDESDRWNGDGHSHSYLTLEEIKKFRSENKTTKYSGMMTGANAEMVDKGEMPNSWCKSTSADDYLYREWEYETDTLKELVEKLEERKKEDYWIWDNEEHPEFDKDLRIVFWFDN